MPIWPVSQDDGPWAVLYVANWHFIADSGGYWESFAQPSMFDHLWSLAIEEQFYLLWPLVLVAIWKWSSRPTRTLVVGSGVAIGLSFVAMVLLYDGVEPTRVYMGTDTRAASLLVGALAATEPAAPGRTACGVGARGTRRCRDRRARRASSGGRGSPSTARVRACSTGAACSRIRWRVP